MTSDDVRLEKIFICQCSCCFYLNQIVLSAPGRHLNPQSRLHNCLYEQKHGAYNWRGGEDPKIVVFLCSSIILTATALITCVFKVN